MGGVAEPKPGRRDDLLVPWLVLGLGAAVEVFAGLLWIAQGAATILDGRGWAAPAFRWGIGPLRELATGRSEIPKTTTFVVLAVLLLAVAFGVIQAASLIRRRRRDYQRLASARAVNARADVEGMTAKPRAAETARLHPALMTAGPVGGRADVRDVLGTVLPSGPEIFPGFEDVEIAWMAPRSGKTTSRAVPRVLAAPGAVVATANKPDLYRDTWLYRQKLGTVWRFDPQQVTRAVQTFWWNPLRLVVDDESARQLAAQFVQAIVPNGGDKFWTDAAADLLSALFLAAALNGLTLREVWRWLNAPTDDEPVRLLEDRGAGSVAESLRGTLVLHPETRDSIFQTARTGASCLRNPNILKWVTRQPGLPEFQMRDFVRSTDAMYLMSKDSAGAAAPLLAGFLDQLFDVCQDEAERHGDRLPVPVTAVLDEVGNIAPWDRLPKVASFAGSIGVLIIAILQSWAQGKKVWGDVGMEMLYGAATVKVFGAGIDDDRLMQRIAQAIGKHDVFQRSTTYSDGGHSETSSPQERDALPPDAVRAMPKGTALVFATGRRPVLIQLIPWYETSYRDIVEESKAAYYEELDARLRGSRP
ncbi:hypothetical protein BS329_38635 [Amycolatopsis coloradensis]|uniref:TraD/TraG TraM recognition site domain-containing protein n=1 Tax=Amycolatopsis coloradensis TaxID=76021 RepID=A0A1R0KEL2_9PSEU|nr:type IV secretory system conjugative DNA transfer family protein [Amycolatopsis coloradensis]OLZ43577.1 hypothetical protein BS329_38635 [Amycolatopsis coloradensis]